MEIIVSHNRIDFDGLASMVAANKLYPKATMAFVGKPNENVKEFLSLHKDLFEIKNPRQIDLKAVKKIIIVDVKRSSRIGVFANVLENPGIEVIIYDHHPHTDKDVVANFQISESIGATTTLLIEQLIKNKCELNPFEATVLALGIYEDTGALTFSSTTARDAKAVAWLLEQGANLNVIANFIERPLSEEQQDLLNNLLAQKKIYDYNAIKILIATARISKYIGGLDIITHKISDIVNLDVVFLVVKMDDRIHIVARSRVEGVQVNSILAQFGGAGHKKAASATVKEMEIDSVLEKLHKLLNEEIKPLVKAEDIMTSPVKTVDMNTSITDAGKIMLRYGHTGLPVVDGEKIVGIVSRRDLEKAEHHGLGHAPVKGYMSWKVVSVTLETPLPIIQQLMIEKDIGRLPVIDNDALVGIISRSDVMRISFGYNLPHRFQINFGQKCNQKIPHNLHNRMKSLLPPHIYRIIITIGDLADRMGYNAFLVGGFVRDLLLGVPNIDLDIVVEGNGITFAKILGDIFKAKVRSHEKFATAIVFLDEDLKIDVATARREFYEYPAALPIVEASSLKQDLYRRDFTINSMAISINKASVGMLIDFFCGQEDLDLKRIRVLYNLSFVEDPTRIIRAVRFEQRYGFTMEPQTLNFALDAINNSLIEKLSFHRVREELTLILKEVNPYPALKRMNELGLWEHLLTEVRFSTQLINAIKSVPNIILTWKRIFPQIDQVLIYLLVLFNDLNFEQIMDINNRFQWKKKYWNEIIKIAQIKDKDVEILHTNVSWSLSAWHNLLKDLAPEGILYFIIFSHSDEQRNNILNYLIKKKSTIVEINGTDLKALGLIPGPRFKELLELVFEKRLEGQVNSKEEEIAFIRQIITNERGD